jgi:homoserine dehydrogenase
VAGGIPLIRPLRESLRGEPITRVMGILNGTTNFILTKMTEEGADYGVALAEAQELGYAERDPTADVEGFDAGAKAAIIATIAFGARSSPATSTTRASAASPPATSPSPAGSATS